MEKAQSGHISAKIKSIWKKLSDKSYRDSFLSFKIDSDVAAQIYAMREQRSLTQDELGKRAGMAQSRIAKLEGSCEGVSVNTLKRLAVAFDTALVIKFAPFSEFIREEADPLDKSIPSFSDDHAPVARSVTELKIGSDHDTKYESFSSAARILVLAVDSSKGLFYNDRLSAGSSRDDCILQRDWDRVLGQRLPAQVFGPGLLPSPSTYCYDT